MSAIRVDFSIARRAIGKRSLFAPEWITTLEGDGYAGAWVMCMIARPHKPDLGAKFIDDLGRHSWKAVHGREHPDYPLRGNRGADYLTAPLTRLTADFRKGLKVGDIFNRSLLGAAIRHPYSAPAPAPVARLAARPSRYIASLAGKGEDRTARRHHWQKYMPFIHLAGAVNEVAIERGWPVAGSGPNFPLLESVLSDWSEWLHDALERAEQKRRLAYIYGVGAPKKMNFIRFQ